MLGLIISIFGAIIAITGYSSHQDSTAGPVWLGVAAILIGIMLELCLKEHNDDLLTILNPETRTKGE